MVSNVNLQETSLYIVLVTKLCISNIYSNILMIMVTLHSFFFLNFHPFFNGTDVENEREREYLGLQGHGKRKREIGHGLFT